MKENTKQKQRKTRFLEETKLSDFKTAPRGEIKMNDRKC